MQSTIQKTRNSEPYQSVAWLIVVLTGSVFIIETLIMFLLDSLPPIPKIDSFLLDSTLLSALLFPIFYFLVFRPLLQNITERKKAEDELRVAAVTFETKGPILITDADTHIIQANKMLLGITGYNMEDLVGQKSGILNSGRHNKQFYEQMWKQLLHNGSWTGGITIKCKDGNIFPLGVTITAVKNEQQEITHFVAIYNYG